MSNGVSSWKAMRWSNWRSDVLPRRINSSQHLRWRAQQCVVLPTGAELSADQPNRWCRLFQSNRGVEYSLRDLRANHMKLSSRANRNVESITWHRHLADRPFVMLRHLCFRCPNSVHERCKLVGKEMCWRYLPGAPFPLSMRLLGFAFFRLRRPTFYPLNYRRTIFLNPYWITVSRPQQNL